MTIPNEVYILKRSDKIGSNYQPVEIKIGDLHYPWDEAPVKVVNDHYLEVDGHPYRWHRSLGMREGPDSCTDAASAYRLMIGWRVMCEYPTDSGPAMIPAQSIKHPVDTFDEAEQIARSMVTRYLASLNSPLRVEIAWQHGTEFGEPVAGLDGNNYTRIQATRAMFSNEWLPLDYDNHDEAGDAPTPPASRSTPSNDGQEPTRDKDTIIRDLAQVRTVSPEWGGQPGTNAVKAGITEVWDSRPFAEVEELVRSLGWRPIGKQGAWQNPKWDAEAEQTRQKWERKLAARYGTA